MSIFKVKDAYNFYQKFIHNEELQKLLHSYELHVAGSVPSVNWELFGAILTGDKGRKGYGSDLKKHEIKSALSNASFEYQYHLRGGQKKLIEDMEVKHLFISYSPDYKDVVVRILPGEALKEKFIAWLPKLVENYEGLKPKQRFRRSIAFGLVKKSGVSIMQIKGGKLV